MKAKMIKQYIREGRDPVGVVVAVKSGSGLVNFGYSLCSPKDQFDKSLGEHIARQRAEKGEVDLPDVKDRRNKVLAGLVNVNSRAKRYFKDTSPAMFDESWMG